MTTLRALVAPSRVAIVGLDARNAPAGRALAARLVADGFAGALDLVDPAGGDGPGDTPVARRADELPSAPDLAILCVDPRDVRWQLEAVLARGAGAVAILTDDRAAGASPGREDDDDGAPAELADLAAAAGAVMLGPASAGVANPGLGLVAIPDAPALMGGAVAIVARRGPALLPLLAAVARREVGVAWALDLGAAPGVDVAAALAAAHGDDAVRAVILAAPDLGEPAPALVALAALAADKPVVVLDPEAALFAELGAAPATTADDAARLAALLATDGAAPAGGQRVAVVTDDAALGALAAASLGATGLTLAAPGAETARRIAGEVHAEARIGGVVDLLGGATPRHVAVAAEALVHDAGVDSVLVAVSRPVGEALDAARDAARAAGKPLVAGPPEGSARALAALAARRRAPAFAIAQLDDTSPARAQAVLAGAILMRRTTLSGDEARRLLEAYGVRAARAMTIASPMAARRAASELGYPVTLTLRATGHVATRAALRDGDAVDDAIHALFADAPQADPALAFELRRTASAERFAALTVTADARLGGRVTLTATPGAGACALALTAAAAPEGLVARALGVAADAAPPELVALVARVAQLALDFPEIARLDVGPIAEEPGGFSVLAASATLPRDLLPSRR